MPEDDERELPSVQRREIELGRGVVLLPPERIKGEQKEREEKAVSTRPAPEIVRVAPASNLVAVLAIFIAVIAAVLASFSMYNLYKMKGELRAVAEDLRSFQGADISISTRFSDVTHTVQASLPLREVITPFVLPILPQELQGKGKIAMILPGFEIPVSIPWEGNVTVSGSINVDTAKLSEDRRMVLGYQLPGEGQLTIGIKGKDLWTENLDNVLKRIEAMSK